MHALSKLGLIVAVGTLAIPGTGARAAAPGGAGPRTGMVAFRSLTPLGLGVDVERMRRGIRLDDGTRTELEADLIAGVFTLDPVRGLQLFVTARRIDGTFDGAGNGGRWHGSAGFHARLWHLDVNNPAFLTGRLSLGATAEIARATSGDSADIRWNERFAALVFAYEIFVENADALQRVPYSLRFSAGPAWSELDGRTRIGGERRTFEETRTAGVNWGVELFIAQNLSVGFHGQHFDADTYRGTMRYRF